MTKPLRLFLSACLYPGGLLDHSRRPREGEGTSLTDPTNLAGPPDYAFKRWLVSNSALRIDLNSRADLVMAGDQIYVDATAGLFDPRQKDEPLERTYAALRKQEWRSMAIFNFESVALMDDHEVGDNWEPSAHFKRNQQLEEELAAAVSLFLKQQRTSPRNSTLSLPHTLLSGHLLFVGDSRTERSARDAKNLKAANIMSRRQMNALVNALAQASEGQWKFAATSSILLPRRLSTAEGTYSTAIRSDAWDGYPASLHELLGEVADRGLQNCVFLSGDEHIPCVARVTLKPRGSQQPVVKLWSVHAGALYAPYPFANAVPEDFADTDAFNFVSPNGTAWTCEVTAEFPPHLDDGFLEITGNDGAPLEVVFRSAHGAGRDHAFPQLI